MQPYFDPTRKTKSQKNGKQAKKKWKMEDDLKKMKIEDNPNFKAVLSSLSNNKTSKTNGFDTIENWPSFV
jgi:hypothetical protein